MLYGVIPCDTIRFMVRLFYTVITTDSSLHSAAWKLLTAALNREDPVRFPAEDPDLLPEIIREEYGKPRFSDESLPRFSLSHSGKVAVCAIDDAHAVGVDIQRIETRVDHTGISRRFFHPMEQEYLQSIPDEAQRRDAFFRIFACKEAHSKRTGLGLAEIFTGFYADPAHSLILNGSDGRVIDHCYSVLRDPAFPDYALAVCASEPFDGISPVLLP